eukprot:TRINITY_DN3564_c1_g1_i1.p1 TRINITY_DN3564_c1_g1~~TRINITY_DN3564_c1_g1_i1.p1  ORF type:complete len:184 (-),score=90.09 TRINITY_DN3564_c1_g1_i1:97-600(-)
MALNAAVRRLMQEFKEASKFSTDGIAAAPINLDNLFTWEACIVGPEDTPYDGGFFTATLNFPRDYPLSPPKMYFTCEMWHPNIEKDGKVCISILHPPGDDPFKYESSTERWSPVQSIEKILLSVISMLADPNDESSANVEAGIMWRKNRAEFNARVRRTILKSHGLQ